MKLRYFFLALALAVICVVSIAGFRGQHFSRPPFEIFPDMIYQDKVKDQVPSAFFADGNSARAPIPGTVAMEMPAQNDYWATGKWDDTHWGDGIPVHEAREGGRALQVDAADLARGRERYTISCEVCHGAAGNGQGITSKYGLNGAASYHVDRLRKAPDGQIFDTISNGTGQMLGYGYNIAIDDRWRIVMYVRALQRSQNAAYEDASPEEQAQLEKTKKPAAPSAPAPAAPAPATSTHTTNQHHYSFEVGYQLGQPVDKPFHGEPLSLTYGAPCNPKPGELASNQEAPFATVSFSGGPDYLLSGSQKATGSCLPACSGSLVASCALRAPGQQVVRATPELDASSAANFTP